MVNKLGACFQVSLCKPRGIYICDGSDEEAQELTLKLTERGTLTKLTSMDNWWVIDCVGMASGMAEM